MVYVSWVNGSVIQNDGDIEEDVNHRIQILLNEMERCFGYYFDKKVPLEIKGKFYLTIIKLMMLYGTK